MYSIGEVSEMCGLPASTLRYYDKQGLFPEMERSSGIRKFGEQEIAALRVIDCLKRSGLEIKDIKQFMDWCVEGPSTYAKRYDLFAKQKAEVEAEIARMRKTLDLLKYKCWYYETLMAGENEETLKQGIPDALPKDIKKLYLSAYAE